MFVLLLAGKQRARRLFRRRACIILIRESNISILDLSNYYDTNGRKPVRIDGQAKKSARGMPWHQEPMKVVISCDKPRGAAHKRYIRGSLNGATRHGLYCVNHT